MSWSDWRTEVEHALRRLRRRPALVTVSVLTLGIGVGANTAVFNVMHTVLVAPLPYQDAERLVRIYGTRTDRPGEFDRNYLPNPATRELRDEVPSLTAVAIMENYAPEGADLTGGDRPERLRLLRVNSDYFRTLGFAPMVGRLLTRDEERSEARVAVVRESIWQRHMAADPTAVGGTLMLDGEAVTVVGVVSDASIDPLEGVVDVWVPSDLGGARVGYWDDNYLTVLARLAQDATLASVRSELDVLQARHADVAGAEEQGFTLVPLQQDVAGDLRPLLNALMGAVGFVLLLTCINVAGILVASASGRQRELAIRTALGSGRGGLVRQFLVETGIIALAGGVAGVAIGLGALDLLTALAPADLPTDRAGTLGAPAIVFAGCVSAVIAGLLGVLTAVPFTKPVIGRLVSAPRSDATPGGHSRVRAALVAVQVAVAVVLLSGAGVLLRTLQRLQARDLGAEPAGVLTFQVGLPDVRYGSGEALYAFNAALHRRIAALPGVTSVGATSRLPVTGSYNSWGTKRAHAVGDLFDVPNRQVNQRWVAGDFFETAGLQLRSGRLFDATDEAGGAYRTVINETLADALFDGEDPLGALIHMGGRYTEVVGVVEDEALTNRAAAAPIAYHHLRQWISGSGQLTQMVAATGDPVGLVPLIREQLRDVDPDLVLFQPTLLEDVIGRGIARERFASRLIAVFAALATLLAAMGLYGLLAQLVSHRRHEIGVRIALGADRAGIVRLVVRGAVGLVAAGAVAGVLLATALAGTLESFVYEVGARDPATLVLAPLTLLVVALVSSALPARRAARVDAVQSLSAD